MPAIDTIQVRRGTAAEAVTANPTLIAGEIGYETDTGRIKIGDGSTAWTSLKYPDTRASVTIQSGNYTIPLVGTVYCVYTGSGGHTFTLPAAAGGVLIKIANAGSGSLTVSRAGSDTIFAATSGNTSVSFAIGDAMDFVPISSTAWKVF